MSVAPTDLSGLSTDPRPVLLIPVYRGGERFERCLRSLACARDYFSTVVLSMNSEHGSVDFTRASEFQQNANLPVVVLSTRTELTSMDHTRFWADQLRSRHLPESTHLMWLGHDDELNPDGLAISCPDGHWPLREGTMLLGPWKLRHESVGELYQPPADEQLETWTCFPDQQAKPQTAIDWVCDQLLHPTYLNLTGGVFTFASVLDIIDYRIRKQSGMRMEMTLTTTRGALLITELSEPITIVYGRADSDRATIPSMHARADDRHLLRWLTRYATFTPRAKTRLATTVAKLATLRARVAIGKASMPAEDWVVRS